VGYERGQHTIPERNDDYWRGKEYTYLDRVVWRFMPDKAAAAAALEAGEMMETAFNGISMSDTERLQKDGRFDTGTKGFENNVAHSTVEFNLRNPILANLKVRQAIRSEEHTSELQSRENLVCRLLLEKKKQNNHQNTAQQ